jgi:hypothetical protein
MAAPRAATAKPEIAPKTRPLIQEYPPNAVQNIPEIANEIVRKTIVRIVRTSAILIMNLRNPRIFSPPINSPTLGKIPK